MLSLFSLCFILVLLAIAEAASPTARFSFGQCECESAGPFTDSSIAGQFSDLAFATTGAASCPEKLGFASPSTTGAFIESTSSISEGLRSEISSTVTTFTDVPSSGVSAVMWVKPSGFALSGGVNSISASLVEVRSTLAFNGAGFPKLNCGLQRTVVTPNGLVIYIVSEQIGLSVDFTFAIGVPDSALDDYHNIACGLTATGPFACLDGTCQSINLGGSYTPSAWASTDTIVVVGGTQAAKQYTTVGSFEMKSLVWYSESVIGSIVSIVSSEVGIGDSVPVARNNFTVDDLEDAGSVAISDLDPGYFYFDEPIGSNVSFRITSLPSASQGTLRAGGNPISLPFQTSTFSTIDFVPAANYYTSGQCTSEADFLPLFSYEVSDVNSAETCVITAQEVQFCLEGENDPPVVGAVAIALDSDGVVKLQLDVTDADDEIHNSVDLNFGLSGGTITFQDPAGPATTSGTLFQCNGDGSCGTTVIDPTSEVLAIGTELCICYLQPSVLTGASVGIVGTDFIAITVVDEDGASSGLVEVEIQIKEVLSTCAGDTCVATFEEGQSDGVLVLVGENLLMEPIDFVLVSLPAHGTLLIGTTAVEVDDVLSTTSLAYIPDNDYFNSNEAGGNLDPLGVEICSPACPDTFEFKIIATATGDFKTDNFSIFVTSQRSSGSIAVVPSTLSLEVNVPQTLDGSKVVDTLDLDMYPSELIITFNGGALDFSVDLTSAVSVGTGSIGDNVNVTSSSCAVASLGSFCTNADSVSFYGYPTHLTDLLSVFSVRSTSSSGTQSITVEVVDIQTFTSTIKIEYKTAGAVDAAIIAVAVVASIAAALAVVGLYWNRKRKQKLKSRLDLEREEMAKAPNARRLRHPPKKPDTPKPDGTSKIVVKPGS